LLKRLLFLIAAFAPAVVADAQGETPKQTPLSTGLDIADVKKRVAALERANAALTAQLAALSGHTHAFAVPAAAVSGTLAVDTLKGYVLRDEGNYGGHLLLVRDPHQPPAAPVRAQTGTPIMHSA
jgi:hypothetical protein